MKLPQNVYDNILSYWSYVKTLKERDYLQTHWFIMNEMSCCSIARRKMFLDSWRQVLPDWYDTFTTKLQCNQEMMLDGPVLSGQNQLGGMLDFWKEYVRPM